MKVIKFTHILAFIIVLSNGSLFSRTIHIFGDSHASFCFRQDSLLKNFEKFDLSVAINDKQLILPFSVNWLGPITMHRVGRDGIKFLNAKKRGAQEHDIALFVFGEIDVRCHIGKQRDEKQRDENEIINTLAFNYINTLKANQKLFDDLTVIVCCVTPPVDGIDRMNPDYPFYGSLADRVEITKSLNKKLQKLCRENNFLFLDFYDLYADYKGALNLKFADRSVHIDYIYNMPIKKKLIELIAHLL